MSLDKGRAARIGPNAGPDPLQSVGEGRILEHGGRMYRAFRAIQIQNKGSLQKQAERKLCGFDPPPDLGNANVGMSSEQQREAPQAFPAFCTPKKEKDMLRDCLERVRARGPLVHNITNTVTMNDCANMLLACGASPIMADDEREAEEITALCAALNINIGTLSARTIPAMFRAGRKAAALQKPIVLDPVGAGASRLRTDTALELMREIPFTVIRGNGSEIKTLARGSGSTHGVDADGADAVTEETLDGAVEFVRGAARQLHGILAVTGPIDLVSDGKETYVIRNGRPEMGRVTGTGCQLSALLAAFLAANPGRALEAAAAAVCAMGLAGEIGFQALRRGEGNSTYRNRIIDAVYNMTGEQLEQGARYEIR